MMTDMNYREAVQSMRNRTTRLDREGDYWNDDEKEKLRSSSTMARESQRSPFSSNGASLP